MLKLKNISILLVCIVMLISFMSCSDDDEPVERLRPSLSVSSLNLEVGDSAILKVNNVESGISVFTDAPKVIALRVVGTDIIVKALSQGEAIISVRVSGARLTCNVVVLGMDTPEYDFNKELQDERCRFVSPTLTMYYDTPGTIVSVTKDNVIEVRSLITGDNISFNPGTKTLAEGNIHNASLKINNTPVSLKQTTLHRLTPTGSMWFALLDTKGNRIVLVITDL